MKLQNLRKMKSILDLYIKELSEIAGEETKNSRAANIELGEAKRLRCDIIDEIKMKRGDNIRGTYTDRQCPMCKKGTLVISEPRKELTCARCNVVIE